MKKIVLTLCLFAMSTMAYGSNLTINSESSKPELTQQHPRDDRKDDHRDDRKKKTNYYERYEKQELEVKRLYRELNEERNGSRRYNEIKREFNDAQVDLREIRTTAKRNDVRITASKWETVKVR
ncbi:MAG: hypothetical protein R3Y49_02895 [Rikenellaceae bacterium]